jgi:negative regulator of sigma E activity
MPFRPLALTYSIVVCGLMSTLPADSTVPSGDAILAKVEIETSRRHLELTEYSGSRLYTLQNGRFGQEAAAAVLMRHRILEGDRFTVVTRSGSNQLSGIIDKLLLSEAGASLPPETARHAISAANYRVRLLGSETAAGRACYVLALSPRMKSQFLIVGRVWVDAESYAVVRMEGQFAASMSVLVGAPRITEEFVDVHGFWLPGHVRSVTSSILLGPTELDIQFSNYQLDQDGSPRQ